MSQTSGYRTDDADYNPFAAPIEQSYAVAGEDSDAERVRRELIGHEASIQSIGLLYLIGATFLVVFCGVSVISYLAVMTEPRSRELIIVPIMIWAVLAGLGALQFWVGLGLRRLQAWTRIPVGVISTIGLIGFPIGTLINAYILYLILGSKGTRVFSPSYQEIIRQTPHIKYKTSVVVKIFLGLLIFVIVMGIIAVVMS